MTHQLSIQKLAQASKALKVGFLALLMSLFFYSPRLRLLLSLDAESSTRRDDLLKLCADLFARDLDKVKLGFRLVQPFIANALHLCGGRRDPIALLGSPGIAYVAMALTLSFVYIASKRKLGDPTGLILTFALASTMVTQWTNLHWGHPDSISLMCIAFLMCSKSVSSVILSVAIGCTNDERFLIALPLIALWWWSPEARLKEFLKTFRLQIVGAVVGVVIWLVFRFMIGNGLIGPGIVNPYQDDYVGLEPLMRLLNPKFYPGLLIMMFLSYRWLWFLPIVEFRSVMKGAPGHNKVRECIKCLSISGIIVAATCMADISRTWSFAFPIILIAATDLVRFHGWSISQLRQSLLILLAMNLMSPALIVFDVPLDSLHEPSTWMLPMLPLPVNLWNWLRFQ